MLARFREFFGARGGDQVPGNVGKARQLAHLCQEALANPAPVLFDYFNDWHGRQGQTPVLIAQQMAAIGLRESAWDVVHLHHLDQTQKKEAADGRRLHKGDPYCGMAILGQMLGSRSLARHYAQLSSAGDVYWEHELADLEHGGLGATIMEAYESRERHDAWRATVRERLNGVANRQPRYLDVFLLMRWFGEAHANRFFDASRVRGREGLPFAEVLLSMVRAPRTRLKGKLFEAATALLVSATPGFEVRSARKNSDEQVDFVVRYERDPLTVLPLTPGPGLVECKSSGKPVTVSELRDFGSKCLFHRVSFGILIARNDITGGGEVFSEPRHAELVRRRFLVDGITILVVQMSDLEGRARQLRGLQEPLAQDHDLLVFGPIDGAVD
jgi:Restriction endonuclease